MASKRTLCISLQSCLKGDQAQFPNMHRIKQAAVPRGRVQWSQNQASLSDKPLTERPYRGDLRVLLEKMRLFTGHFQLLHRAAMNKHCQKWSVHGSLYNEGPQPEKNNGNSDIVWFKFSARCLPCSLMSVFLCLAPSLRVVSKNPTRFVRNLLFSRARLQPRRSE